MGQTGARHRRTATRLPPTEFYETHPPVDVSSRREELYARNQNCYACQDKREKTENHHGVGWCGMYVHALNPENVLEEYVKALQHKPECQESNTGP